MVGLSLFAVFIVAPYSFSLTKIHWLLEGDLAQMLIGWEFYRISPPALPVTRIANMYPESGFYILQTDTAPWVSILVKKLAQAFDVKTPFHFFGLWLILCWVAQGVYAALIGRFLKLSPLSIWLLIFLFVFSPILLFRFEHFSLMAHWIVLAVIYESLRLSMGNQISLTRTLYLIVLTVASLGIHPYLFAITAPILSLIILLNQTFLLRKLLEGSLVLTLLYGSIKVLGIFSIKNPRGTDFGACNTDLLGILNTFNSSLFFPQLRHFWCQPEGFVYFGIAFLMLLIILRKNLKELIKQAWKARPSRYFILLCGLYIIYSLASPLRFGGNPILYIPFYKYLEPLPSIFRSSGRWIWPFYYCILIAGVYILDRSKMNFKNILMGALVVIHFIEFTPLMRVFMPSPPSMDKELERIMTVLPRPSIEKDKMNLYPRVVSVGCGIEGTDWDYRNYSLVMIALARMGWKVDSGLGGRLDQALVDECLADNKKGPPQSFPLITKVLPQNEKNFVELWTGLFLMTGEME